MSSSFSKLLTSSLLFLLVLININTKYTQAEETYCGSKLIHTLDLICEYGFGTKLKKSVAIDYYSDNEEETPFAFEKFPFLAKFQENSLAKTRRRRYQGVAHECCDKPCTMDELKTFCKINGNQ